MSFPLRTGIATLAARTRLTPRMLRVTLAHSGFGPGWPIRQPGEIVTLRFGEPIVLPALGRWSFPPGTPAQDWRNYTVRAHRPAAGEIDVDVVLHEPRGPACTQAGELPLGAPVGYAGPRVDFQPQAGAAWLLLCGDETALPAIAAILDAPPVERVLAVVEVHDADERLALPVRWVDRGGAAAATTTHLADAVRELALPRGPGQVWGGAESGVARALRGILRGERGLARAVARGYWLRRPQLVSSPPSTGSTMPVT